MHSLSIFPFLCSFMGLVQRHKFLVSINGGPRIKNVCPSLLSSIPETCNPDIELCLIFTVGGPELKVFPIKGLQSRQCSTHTVNTEQF